MRELLVSYVYSFISFLVRRLGDDFKKIKRIILFGSVARGDFTEESDIDLFIETEERLSEKIQKIKEEFYKSSIYRKYWRLRNIKNPLSILVGKIDQFPSLKESLFISSIILYETGFPLHREPQFVLVYWEKVKEKKKIMQLKRFFEGYRKGTKEYPGKVWSNKISSNCYIIKREDFWKVYTFLRELGIAFHFRGIV